MNKCLRTLGLAYLLKSNIWQSYHHESFFHLALKAYTFPFYYCYLSIFEVYFRNSIAHISFPLYFLHSLLLWSFLSMGPWREKQNTDEITRVSDDNKCYGGEKKAGSRDIECRQEGEGCSCKWSSQRRPSWSGALWRDLKEASNETLQIYRGRLVQTEEGTKALW